jgi:predicted aspartyl protease
MRIRKILGIVLLIALAAWGIETVWLVQHNLSMPSQIRRQAEAERRMVTVKFRDRERKLNDYYSQKKYLATGQTVYDRIFNTKEQTVVELIQRMAAESLPNSWNCEARVEEFTHFILLVYLPHNCARVAAGQVAFYLMPVIKHCSWCLSNVAVFDRMHKSYLFFDNDTLKHLEGAGSLTDTLLAKAKQQGESFTRFNSTTLQCEKYEQHLIVPIEIAGSSGVVSCPALFDTGASTTMLSKNVISSTGYDNLANVPTKSFSTANGWMSCPIVHREVNLGGFRKRIEVAVNQRDELNLLGMNYFKGMKYIVDSQNACIYIWEEPSIKLPRPNYDVSRDDLRNPKSPVEDDRAGAQPENKESPSSLSELSGDLSSRDVNDLATLADKWLE